MEALKQSRYLNLLTDFGFKYVLADEKNKQLLINLLNEIIGGEKPIVDIRYLPQEQLGLRRKARKAIFDIFCENDRGERFITEMQVGKQTYFMDRSLFYSTFPIQTQAKKGVWNFKLKPVYHIGLLDFIHDKENDFLVNHFAITNKETHKTVSEALNFITIELPKFNKSPEELENGLDCWLYCFRNMGHLKERPKEIKGAIFDLLFEVAEINKLTPKDMEVYEKSLAEYSDVRLMMECNFEEGREEGMEKGIEKGMEKGMEKGREKERIEIARKGIKGGISMEVISELTGFSPAQIRQLQS
jgi:predicted transposase/invertase (TIGR01784 family)